MSIQKSLKKGFTLIELMVVIVIIGILAAVAIPKLFGMSAKAKASEVSPAAGTWIKLQLAYDLEQSQYGSFTEIGYTKPSSNNFNYEGKIEGDKRQKWEATNIDKLNDCPANSTWSITMSKDASPKASIGGDEIVYKDDPEDKKPADAPDDWKPNQIPDDNAKGLPWCTSLTPSFPNVVTQGM